MPKILVVDDEEPLLELVSAILRGEGYDVHTANGGHKALETLEQESIDLVLLDVMMPEMDGWDVVKEMKSKPTLRDIPIAMLTVKAMSPQYFYSDEVEGLVDYINKPFPKKELIDRVKTIFEEARRIESVKKGLKSTTPEFMKEYEEISRTERLYENLLSGLEYSLLKMEGGSHDYKLVKDALDYGKVLLERIKEKKEAYEKLIEK
jgi:two-component system response regulator VicR